MAGYSAVKLYFSEDVWRMSRKDKIPMALFAVYLEDTLFKDKNNSYILFENWIWGHANILTLEEQKDNF